MVLRVERDDGLVRITVDNPRRSNALTVTDLGDLRVELERIAGSDEDRAVLLSGAGPTFCSGVDVAGMPDVVATARALHHLPQVVVAAVGGPAVDIGTGIALACDLVVASSRASFRLDSVRRGLPPTFGSTWLLPRTVGLQAAKRLALLGDTLDAEEALRLGLVAQVVPPDALDEVADRIARRLADGPPIAQTLTKRLLDASFARGFDETLEDEADATAVAADSEDVMEAFIAIATGRAPVFVGA
ncbi:enoyl-CoA hydratase-related protein [Mumia sp. DW29H23]|uniref:enoyl-CoA hydratase-related protein n=1 Tax=Mumia sp. DW29H23 TaxID=3421241 RepID=UPI003D686239